MPKRNNNIFGYSSDSDSGHDEEKINKRQIKKPKKLPSYLTDKKENSSDSLQNEESTSTDQCDNYMNYKIDDKDTSEISEEIGNYNQLKYYEIQRLSRERGLKKSLFENESESSPKSIGLSIMEKMGFKIGESLGANQSAEKKRHVPISIELKSDKSGLGFKLWKKENDNPIEIDENNIKKYRSNITNDKDIIKLEKTIYKIRKFCFEISGDADKFYNDENFEVLKVNTLWRPYVVDYIKKKELQKNKAKMIYIANEASSGLMSQLDVENNDEILDNNEILNLLLYYLRSNYNYCWYCGCYFDNYDELEKNCPGVTELDHT